MDDVPPGDVDAVVTLCAEEVCPVFLGKALRVHWGLPDPAAAPGTDDEKLKASRDVRDELRRRLAAVFRGVSPPSATRAASFLAPGRGEGAAPWPPWPARRLFTPRSGPRRGLPVKSAAPELGAR